MLFLAIFFYSQLLSDNDSRDSIKPLFFFLCPFLCLFYHVGECITNLIWHGRCVLSPVQIFHLNSIVFYYVRF